MCNTKSDEKQHDTVRGGQVSEMKQSVRTSMRLHEGYPPKGDNQCESEEEDRTLRNGKQRETKKEERGTRNEEQGTRNKEQGTGNKVGRTREKALNRRTNSMRAKTT